MTTPTREEIERMADNADTMAFSMYKTKCQSTADAWNAVANALRSLLADRDRLERERDERATQAETLHCKISMAVAAENAALARVAALETALKAAQTVMKALDTVFDQPVVQIKDIYLKPIHAQIDAALTPKETKGRFDGVCPPGLDDQD